MTADELAIIRNWLSGDSATWDWEIACTLLDALEEATALVGELRVELRNRVRYIEMPPQTAAMLAKMLPWEVSE